MTQAHQDRAATARTYVGVAGATVAEHRARRWVVSVVDDDGTRPLPLHIRHSPDGHSWGYAGSGPAQLALDLLWHATGREPPPRLYQQFKAEVVAHWPQDEDWSMTADEIRAWIAGAEEGE